MALRVAAFLFVATALVSSAETPQAPAPPPSPVGSGPVHPQETGVVFKLRPGAAACDPAPLLARRLGTGSRGAPGWRPAGLRQLFAGRPGRPDTDDPVAGLGQIYVSDLPRGLGVAAAVALLAADPRVEYAQPDYVRESHSNDTYSGSSGSWGQPYADLWALPKLNVEHAWVLSRGEGIVVAIVDSGVDYLHPELSGRMWTNPDETAEAPDNGYLGDVMGWDFVANDNDPQDEFGHGTHMAGIVAAEADNGIGIAGVAPGARLMAVRVIDGGGRGRSSMLAEGLVYAADNGARVIAVSSGCSARCPSDPVVEQAVRHASAKGALVVVSAGNRGDNLAYYSPQNMIDPRPIVVGASDQLDQRESFSNYGQFLDLLAPGGGRNVAPPAWVPVSNILSLAATFCSPLVCDAQRLVGDGQYLRRHGTSLSAAYVSGVAALVLGADPIATPRSVKQRLFGNAQDLGPRGFEAGYGWGRVTALNSVADLRRYVMARILSPAPDELVSGLVRIVGAADARSFSGYEISVGPGASPTTWQTTGITLVGSPTPQGDLGRWATDGLAPGTWTIRLVVHDAVAPAREQRRTVTVQSAPSPPQLVLDVASHGQGSGSVHVDPPRAFCDGVAGSTQTCSYTYGGPSHVTLTAVPEGLAAFAGWSGACSGTGPCTVDVSARHAVRATFRGPYQLVMKITSIDGGWATVMIDPPGRECGIGETCRFWLQPGTEVTLTAYEGDPFQHFSFTSHCEGIRCTLLMDRDFLVEGMVFQSQQYPPAVSVSAGEDLRVSFGTPVILVGVALQNQFPREPLLLRWMDEFTGASLGEKWTDGVTYADALVITPSLALGIHDFLFTATYHEGAGEVTVGDHIRVVVQDP